MGLAPNFYMRHQCALLVPQYWRAAGLGCGRAIWFCRKLLGEGLRVSMVGAAVPLADGISSSAIDGGLHTFTAAVVTVLGITATLVLAPLPGSWRVYALLVAAVLIAVVGLGAVAVASRWQLMGNAARAIGRLPWLYKFVTGKLPIIDSAERNLLTFYRENPAAILCEPDAQFSLACDGRPGGICGPAFHGNKDRRGRRVCAGGLDKGDQPRWRRESRQLRDLRGWKYSHCKSARCFGHCWIDVGLVSAGAGRVLGSGRGRLRGHNEERRRR